MHPLHLLPIALLALLPLTLADFRPVHVPAGCHQLCDPIANLTLTCHAEGKIHGADYAACMCAANAGHVRLALCAACVNVAKAPGHGINVLVKDCFLTQTVFVGTATEDDGTATVQTVTATLIPTESLDDPTTTAAATGYATATASATGAAGTAGSVTLGSSTSAAVAASTTARGLTTVASSSSSSSGSSSAAAVATASGNGAGKVGMVGSLTVLVVGALAVAL